MGNRMNRTKRRGGIIKIKIREAKEQKKKRGKELNDYIGNGGNGYNVVKRSNGKGNREGNGEGNSGNSKSRSEVLYR